MSGMTPMVAMWCHHKRQVEAVNPTQHITKLVHVDDQTPCTGRNPKR